MSKEDLTKHLTDENIDKRVSSFGVFIGFIHQYFSWKFLFGKVVPFLAFIFFILIIYIIFFKPSIFFEYWNKWQEATLIKKEYVALENRDKYYPIAERSLELLRNELDARLALIIEIHNSKKTAGGFPMLYANAFMEVLRPGYDVNSHWEYWNEVRIDNNGIFANIYRKGGTLYCTHEELDAIDPTNQFENSPLVTAIRYDIIWSDAAVSKKKIPLGVLILSFDSESNTVGKDISGVIGQYRSHFREVLEANFQKNRASDRLENNDL